MTGEKRCQPTKIPTWTDIWPQVLFSLIASCGNGQVGIIMSHSGVLIPQLADDKNIEGFDRDSASWIAGLYSISAIFGALGGPLMDKIGRRKTLLASQIPIIINWVIMSTTYYSIWPLYIARLLGGLGGGLLGVVLYVYIAEISHSQYRATLIILNSFISSLGILLVTVVGVTLEWHVACTIFGLINLVTFLCYYFFIPESPFWMAHFKKCAPEEIQGELRKLNRPEWLFEEAWSEIQDLSVKRTNSDTEKSGGFKEFISVLKERTTYIPLLLIVFIFIFQQASGIYLFTFYSANIFASLGKTTFSGYEVSIDGAVMLMGVLRIISTAATAVLSKVMSKKAIMITTGLATALSLALVSVFMSVNNVQGVDFESSIVHLPPAPNELFSLLAMASLFFFVAVGSMGMVIYPWTLASDLFSTAVRAFGNTFTIVFGNLTLFLVVKTFPFWLDVISLPAAFGIFTCSAMAFVIFVWLYIPNTSNMNFEELAKIFAKK